jgi:predicted nuclease of predicted toxin-antitoxin system
MRFKIDENLPVEIAERLRAEGYIADTVIAQGLAGERDELVFDHCQREQRVLVTMDKGFGDIRQYTPGTHFGILLIRSARQDRDTFIQLIEQVLPHLQEQSIEGCLWIVEPGQVRIRRSG